MQLDRSLEKKVQPDLLPYWTGTVIELIKEISNIYPDAPALKFQNSFLSYEELEERSDQLALYLIDQGMEPEEKIVTIFTPSFDLVVSIYAILKAGGVFVPVNPKDGNERLRFIINDLESKKILGTKETLLKVAGLTNATLIEVTDDGANPLFLTEKKISEPINIPLTSPENLCFIIYTSGTTGSPKGVMVEHRNLFSFIKIMRETIDTSMGDIWLQNPNVHFDLAVGTMFLSLCNGSTLVLETGDLHELMESHSITHYMGTPSTASLVDPERLPNLKVMAVAGEKSPDELIARYAPFGNLYVGYGPAETTIVCTLNRSNQWKQQNLGTVFKGSNYYVVRPDGTLADDNEAGELWISGNLVARGYLNRPELTSEKFIKNPFGEGRMYKSGDRVRWVKPGFMEFVGRVDRQVKIRGNRVELDGLELLINGFGGIKGTHAKVINDNLVAYVVTKSPQKEELLTYLQKLLPPYAIPNKIVFLDKFPLTRSGKIDSEGFPDPFKPQVRSGVLPETKGQKELAIIWKSVLPPLDEVLLEDNFFDLGGNSLSALRLLNKVRKLHHNATIPVDIIYKNPKLKDFEQALKNLFTEDLKNIKLNYGYLLISFIKAFPSWIYFALGYISVFLSFTVIGVFYPIVWAYAVLEAALFGKMLVKAPPLLGKLVGLSIFEKMRSKSMTIIEDVPLTTKKWNLFCLHPHGPIEIHSFSLARYLFKKDIPFRIVMEKFLFNLPFTRTMLNLLGFIPSAEKTYEDIRDMDKNLIVTPGGITEYLVCHEPSTVSLTPNLLFFKTAIQNGLDLTPIYTFNMHSTYKFYPELQMVKKRFAIDPTFLPFQPFRGRFGLPIPFRRDIKMVIGKTLKVPQNETPTWNEIEKLYREYTLELTRIFDKHKPDGYPALKVI